MNDDIAAPSGSRGDSESSNSDLSGFTEAVGGLDAKVQEHDPLIGEFFGDVRIVRFIAEGGMGRVYEGVQEKPRRPVAVKVMRPGSVTPTNRRRFENEAEVLGRLHHPCIAQIFFAGIYNLNGSEVPYFVMEYIADALSMTEFAKRKKLDLGQRLQLFRRLSEAVAHAHASEVIHRDLKPSNVLVGPAGVPKVIDFGVARTVAESSGQMTALTKTGQLVGTFQYMSPEQFFADPSKLDMRADVYALGLIFYELLVGAPPYDLRGKHVVEAIQLLEKYKFVPPSLLNRSVRPQIDKIIETCLQKDCARRYSSAIELSRTLESYIDDEALETHVLSGGPIIRESPPLSSPSNRAAVADVFACPHCDRLFHLRPDVLGKKIRCRGCSQIFYVPKDTGRVPLAEAARPAPVVNAPVAPPVAIECVIDGRDARRCPACYRLFAMKPEHVGKVIRCRVCKASFRVAATVNFVLDPVNTPAGVSQPASPAVAQPLVPPPVPPRVPLHVPGSVPPIPINPPPVPSASPYPTIFEDIGDKLDEWLPGEPVASVVRPQNFAAAPMPVDDDRLQLSAMAIGSASALFIVQMIFWWVFDSDPLNIIPMLPWFLRWLAPEPVWS